MNKLELHNLNFGAENNSEETLATLSDEELHDIDHKDLQVCLQFLFI